MYVFTFFARGQYVGADSFRAASDAHALRLASYVALAFAREATQDFTLSRSDVSFDVASSSGLPVGVNAGAATVAV